MAQYQVPQFIEVEDKIFGPLTLKQFIYLAGGGGLCLMLFTLTPLWLTLLLGTPIMMFCGALAFYKVNGRPFIAAVEHAVTYFFGTKLYLWKQKQLAPAPVVPQTAGANLTPGMLLPPVPKLSESKLKDLSWSLNIKDRASMGITTQERTGFEI